MAIALGAALRTVPAAAEPLMKFPRHSPGVPWFVSGAPYRVSVVTSERSRASSSRRRKQPRNLRHSRRAKIPPDPGISRAVVPKEETRTEPPDGAGMAAEAADGINQKRDDVLDDSSWSPFEIEVLSSLFERRIPQKPVKLQSKRPRPPPPPPKSRPVGFPTPKRHIRSAARSTLSLRLPVSDRVSKSPESLVAIAREIRALPPDVDVSEVLDKWTPYLRKGSLSMTIRELGHMGLPDRALQTLCWAQNHPPLFPDDRILSSAVEVLARNDQLKVEDHMHRYLNSASRTVMEAMAKGFIKAGNVSLARKILLFAKDNNRTLDPSVHAKLIWEAGKIPDRYRLVEVLLDELGEREDLDLKPQDCTAIMKVCIRLGRFEAVERLFSWFKQSGRNPTVVMYTTIIHSRYSCENYREGMGAVWELEESNCLLDLPAYRVVIRLCVALGDLARAARYFSRLKEAGFQPTYDIYKDMIRAYVASGRIAKCKQIHKEVEMAGLKLDKETEEMLLRLEQDETVL